MRCAEQVCAAIAAGQFWPPNEAIRAERDEFAPLIHHGVAESFDWSGSLPPAAK
jgi:ATP-dependent helicase/nuclease subunit B